MVSYDDNYPDLSGGLGGGPFFTNEFIHNGPQSPPPGMPTGNRNLPPQQPGDLPRNDAHDSNSNQTLDEIVQLLKQVVVTVVDHKKENDEFRRKFEEVLKKQDQSLKMLDQSFKLLEYLKRPIFDMASLVKRTVSGRGPARSRPDFSSQIIAPFETPMWSDQPDPSQPRGENKVQELLLEVARAQNRAKLSTIYAKLATKELIGLQTIAGFAERSEDTRRRGITMDFIDCY